MKFEVYSHGLSLRWSSAFIASIRFAMVPNLIVYLMNGLLISLDTPVPQSWWGRDWNYNVSIGSYRWRIFQVQCATIGRLGGKFWVLRPAKSIPHQPRQHHWCHVHVYGIWHVHYQSPPECLFDSVPASSWHAICFQGVGDHCKL